MEATEETRRVDLHDHAYTPFWGWDDETIYMERESNDQRREARHRMITFLSIDERVPLPVPIHMRWLTEKDRDEEGLVRAFGELPAWLECPADHPAAVRFWKAAF